MLFVFGPPRPLFQLAIPAYDLLEVGSAGVIALLALAAAFVLVSKPAFSTSLLPHIAQHVGDVFGVGVFAVLCICIPERKGL